jgi:hypothetical protein
MKSQWKLAGLGLLLAGLLVPNAVVHAQPAKKNISQAGPGRRGGSGFVSTLERTVGLTSEQSDTVKGLLAQQRQDIAAVREATDQKIRALLNGEQQKKFDAMLADQKARRGNRVARS